MSCRAKDKAFAKRTHTFRVSFGGKVGRAELHWLKTYCIFRHCEANRSHVCFMIGNCLNNCIKSNCAGAKISWAQCKRLADAYRNSHRFVCFICPNKWFVARCVHQQWLNTSVAMVDRLVRIFVIYLIRWCKAFAHGLNYCFEWSRKFISIILRRINKRSLAIE